MDGKKLFSPIVTSVFVFQLKPCQNCPLKPKPLVLNINIKNLDYTICVIKQDRKLTYAFVEDDGRCLIHLLNNNNSTFSTLYFSTLYEIIGDSLINYFKSLLPSK